MPFSSHETN